MDNALYVALSRQQILRREMDVVANNIANADTPGFKVEQVISQTDATSLPGTTAKLQFALDTGLSRDFGQGALSQTGRDLDVAIEGDGFSRSTLSAASAIPATGVSPSMTPAAWSPPVVSRWPATAARSYSTRPGAMWPSPPTGPSARTARASAS